MSTQLTLPKPFDTSLGTNFTQPSCPQFFGSFLKNETFVNCYPMSFFLKNSQSYVEIVRQGLPYVEQVLKVSCNADYNQCNQLMNELGKDLINPSNCLEDYNQLNPLVIQAFNDFNAYSQIYQATCLKIPNKKGKRGLNNQHVFENVLNNQFFHTFVEFFNTYSTILLGSLVQLSNNDYSLHHSSLADNNNDDCENGFEEAQFEKRNSQSGTGSASNTPKATYCYTEALFGSQDSSGDPYLYLLPLGINYPSDTFKPTCSECNRKIMSIFHSYTNDTSRVIVNTYPSAAEILDNKCEAGFVQAAGIIPPSTASSANASATSSHSSEASKQSNSAASSLHIPLPPILTRMFSNSKKNNQQLLTVNNILRLRESSVFYFNQQNSNSGRQSVNKLTFIISLVKTIWKDCVAEASGSLIMLLVFSILLLLDLIIL